MLIKTVTIRRLLNAIKIYISYACSVLTKKPFVWGYPISISIEPSAVCNLRCAECPAGKGQLTRDTGILSFEKFVKYFAFFEKHIFYLTLNFQGEPFMNKDFCRIVTHAKSGKVYVSTSTNAHFLNEENCKNIVGSGLDSIIISLDGIDNDSYARYRAGGNFEKVIDGIRMLIDIRNQHASSTPYIILQFIVFRHNEHQIEAMKNLTKELMVDELQLKSAQIYNFENDNQLIPENKKYSRYVRNADGTYQLKKKIRNRCFRIWKSLVITWDGAVVPCCFDKDATYNFGNLNINNFMEIYRGSNYYTFRKQILTGRTKNKMCNNCTE